MYLYLSHLKVLLQYKDKIRTVYHPFKCCDKEVKMPENVHSIARILTD